MAQLNGMMKKVVLTGSMAATFISLNEEVFGVHEVASIDIIHADMKTWMIELTGMSVSMMPYMGEANYYLNVNARFNTIVDSVEHAEDFVQIYEDSCSGEIIVTLKNGRQIEIVGFDTTFNYNENFETVEDALERSKRNSIEDYAHYKEKATTFSL